MPRRSRDNQRKLLSKTSTPPRSKSSLFFGDYELPSLSAKETEDPLGEQH